jgi:polysaccharide export outer membrane protein
VIRQVALVICLIAGANAIALAQPADARYRVRPGDVLELAFTLTPEFNQTVTVRPDGYITLRGGDDLEVTGLTTGEIREKVRTRYAYVLRDPVLTVDVKDFEKASFTVLGEVAKPGQYDLRGEITVTEAMAIAGGFTRAAKHSQVILFRPASPAWLHAKAINVKEMLQRPDLREDLRLQPGDIVFVPRSFLASIREFIPRVVIGL